MPIKDLEVSKTSFLTKKKMAPTTVTPGRARAHPLTNLMILSKPTIPTTRMSEDVKEKMPKLHDLATAGWVALLTPAVWIKIRWKTWKPSSATGRIMLGH